MSTRALRVLSRAALVAGLALAAASPFFAAEPALALCKQGGPHCAPNWNNPGNHFYAPPDGPSDGWVDPDCKYYGNCNSATPSRGPKTGPKPIPGGTLRKG